MAFVNCIEQASMGFCEGRETCEGCPFWQDPTMVSFVDVNGDEFEVSKFSLKLKERGNETVIIDGDNVWVVDKPIKEIRTILLDMEEY